MIRRDINGCSGDSASGRTCYGYVRLCKNAAATQSQREDVAAFARSNGLSLDEWIFDDDGAPLPDFKSGDVLIVSKLFRLGRDIAAVMALLARLLESGATVYSAGDGVKIGGDVSAPVLAFGFGLMARAAKESGSAAVRESMDLLKRAGKAVGRPAGVLNKSKKLDGKRDSIRRLFEQGCGVVEICRRLEISRTTLYEWLKTHPDVKAAAHA